MVENGKGRWLSVLLPCYNVAPYLDDCLRSLLDQADTSDEEFELLCINDGSTDNTGEVLEAYAQRYSHVRVFTTENRGVSAARNLGIEQSRGEYITFVDPDDAVPEDLFCNIKRILTENTDVDILIGWFKPFYEREFDQRVDVLSDYSHYEIIEDRVELRQVSVVNSLNKLPQKSPCAQFFSRKLLAESQIRFRENLALGEDEVFTFEIKAVSRKIIYVPTVFYFYRMREGSAMRAPRDELLVKKQISNRDRAKIYQEKCASDPLALPYYTEAVNQASFLLLLIKDIPYVRAAKRELRALGFYPPKNIKESGSKEKPKSARPSFFAFLKRLLRYRILFWPIWLFYRRVRKNL